LVRTRGRGWSAGANESAPPHSHIVEYPGHDELLRDGLDGAAPAYAELYDRTELLAIRQAAVAIVPSAVTRKSSLQARRRCRTRDRGGQRRRRRRSAADAVARAGRRSASAAIATGDSHKDQVQNQWNENPVGSHHARESQPHTLEWFQKSSGIATASTRRMPETMEFAQHAGHDARDRRRTRNRSRAVCHGATVTDLDLAAGHLQLAEENFRLRGLTGRFIHHDAERLPFPDARSIYYSNGVRITHRTPRWSSPRSFACCVPADERS
jgi:hypothetical protein